MAPCRWHSEGRWEGGSSGGRTRAPGASPGIEKRLDRQPRSLAKYWPEKRRRQPVRHQPDPLHHSCITNRPARCLSRCPNRHFGQVNETVQVSGDDLPSPGSGSGGDDEGVLRATRPAAATDVSQQRPVHPGDVEVIGLDRDRVQYGRDERGATPTSLAVGQLDPDRQLGRGDRGDRNVILIADQRLERRDSPMLGVDQTVVSRISRARGRRWAEALAQLAHLARPVGVGLVLSQGALQCSAGTEL